jgi:hypothetical protein
MPKLSDLKIKLFTDGADKAKIVEMAKQAWIAGFTTNPSLLKKAGVSDYERYARESPPCPTAISRSRCSPTTCPKWSRRPG